MEQKPTSFIERRLAWLEDFKTTVEPINAKLAWSTDGIKSYGLLLVRHMFILNAGALVAAPAYATALKSKELLLNILFVPICLYIVGLILGIFCAVSSYYNFHRISDHAEYERSSEAHKIGMFHFPPVDIEEKKKREDAMAQIDAALTTFNSRVGIWYYFAHGFGWCSYGAFIAGSVVFMMKLAE